jgi:hypothetical protein
MMATVIAAFFQEANVNTFAGRLSPVVETRAGKNVGEIRPVAKLVSSLKETAAAY